MRFCQSFMTELHRHIGWIQDVPAGDIGVGECAPLYVPTSSRPGSARRLSAVCTGRPGSMSGLHLIRRSDAAACALWDLA